jgi:hypothetical protein
MDEWIQAQLAAGLPAFRGSTMAGTVAVNQELLNELVRRWLAAARQPSAARSGAGDLGQLLPFLTHASIRAETGQVLVDFKIDV